jgi:hypothetical protein
VNKLVLFAASSHRNTLPSPPVGKTTKKAIMPATMSNNVVNSEIEEEEEDHDCSVESSTAAALSSSSSSSNLRQRHANKGTTSTKSTLRTATTKTKASRVADNNNDNRNSTNNSNGGSTTSAANTENKQRSMLRQLQAHRQEEQEQKQAVNAAFSNLLKTYLKTWLVLCLVGFALLWFLAPTGVVTTWSQSSYDWLHDTILNPPLPPPTRTLITIYPLHISVRRDLPGFFQAHAIATPHNRLARRAVQQAATLRQAIAQQNNRNIYRQHMVLVPWDVLDFTSQLRTMDSMDRFCGSGGTLLGYGQAFYSLSSAAAQQQTQDHAPRQDSDDISNSILFQPYDDNDEKRHDLMLWCLLASGHHDGYLAFHGVLEIAASVSRGISGIAISTTNKRREKDKKEGDHDHDYKHDNDDTHHQHQPQQHDAIHSTSILFLPQHDSYKLSLGQPLGPSTLVPRKTLAWIVEHVHLPLHAYRRGLEQFLYRVIQEEVALFDAEQQQASAAAAAAAMAVSSFSSTSSSSSSSSSRSNATQQPPPPPKWILWTAACTDTERLSFEQQYRRIATNCITSTTTSSATTPSNSTGTTGEQSSKDSCCSFYDPKLPPLIRRNRRHDD